MDKALLPYLQRADEVAKANPKVAYYCRLYAVDEGMRLPTRDKVTNALLGAVLKQLEADKPKLQLGQAAEDSDYCTQFALKIFDKAEKQDRDGRATAATSKAYYAASVFLEVTRQFGEMDPECAAKQKFAAWRAAEVRSALKQGRAPTPLAQKVDEFPLDDNALEAELAMLERDLHSQAGSSAAQPDLPLPPAAPAIVAPPAKLTARGEPARVPVQAPPVQLPRWQPEWGKPVAYAVGDMALFLTDVGGTTLCKVTHVDYGVKPPQLLVEVDGVAQSVELGRLAPTPRPPAPAAPAAASTAAPTAAQPVPPAAPVYPSHHAELDSHPVGRGRAPAPIRPPAPSSPPPIPAAVPGFTPSTKAVAQAQKDAKYAASSLQFDDVASAITYLQNALALLTRPS